MVLILEGLVSNTENELNKVAEMIHVSFPANSLKGLFPDVSAVA